MQQIEARSIFSAATGFIKRGGFDWTCNTYLGCSLGCVYCYAAFLPQNPRPAADWGKWFAAKVNAVELARKQAKKVAGRAVYLSSVTDPYQPAERSLMLTRGVLEAISPHQPRLVVQTRGPLVVRDIDVLKQFEAVRVNVSVPTDSEDVRKRFEPKAPPLERRWLALEELSAAGVLVGVCVTPTLPLADPVAFADRIARLGPAVTVVQEFHDSRGGFGADTGAEAMRLRGEYNWGSSEYREFVEILRRRIPVFEGEKGFFPPQQTPGSLGQDAR
ncbi:MAG TPA: radical SAM protein [Fimbriiglobus sp.]|jgi:DNA repair photolyase|nr:radical SAM protein [Fimbriiglobus sp.]